MLGKVFRPKEQTVIRENFTTRKVTSIIRLTIKSSEIRNQYKILFRKHANYTPRRRTMPSERNLSLIHINYHAVKAYGAMETWLHFISTSSPPKCLHGA